MPLIAVILVGVAMATATSCEKEKSEKQTGTIIIEGSFNTLLNGCHDDAVIVNVNNNDSIGITGVYECHGEVLAILNNSIEVNDNKLKDIYVSHGKISFICRRATIDDSQLFVHNPDIVCTGDHIPPSLPKYVVIQVIN